VILAVHRENGHFAAKPNQKMTAFARYETAAVPLQPSLRSLLVTT
jgi:hypothetical protein